MNSLQWEADSLEEALPLQEGAQHACTDNTVNKITVQSSNTSAEANTERKRLKQRLLLLIPVLISIIEIFLRVLDLTHLLLYNSFAFRLNQIPLWSQLFKLLQELKLICEQYQRRKLFNEIKNGLISTGRNAGGRREFHTSEREGKTEAQRLKKKERICGLDLGGQKRK